MKTLAITAILLVGSMLISPNRAGAENWPGWRGPRNDGASLEKDLPTRWSATENVLWKTPIPGLGHASPIVWGDRLFLITALEQTQERILLSLDRATGKILWRKTVLKAPLEKKHDENSYASSTPVTDGEKVYVTFLDGQDVVVAAYDFAGEQRWLVRPGTQVKDWGFCSPPFLFEDRVIVSVDSKGDSFLAALSRDDGRTLWKTPRDNPSNSYSAPLIRTLAGRPQIVLPGNGTVSSYNPADGSRIWFIQGPASDFVATPVYSEPTGLVITTSSWPKRVLQATRPDGQGDVTQTKIVWSTPEGAPYVPSPVVIGDYLLTASNSNEAFCYEAATGKVLWHEKYGRHHASPVATADGLVYFVSDSGQMNVVKPGPTYELVARNQIDEQFYASPAISGGCIFLRGDKHLYCIGRPAQ